jgi:dTDP-4-amino-4,6-dideoxygalactose transaminase
MNDLYTSRTRLPKLSRYNWYLKKLWKSRYLTNNGVFVQKLEEKLKKRWGVKHVICVANGTLATELAIKALDIKGEIYVDPFSYISTISVPMWMGIKPIFTEYHRRGPALVTHCYGFPHLVNICPVIYDASHAFAVRENGKSILTQGNCSIISFHATKLFQSVEGGAIVTDDDDITKKVRWMRNFGHDGQYKYFGVGINAKMSEFHAAMGLCSLEMIDQTLGKYCQIIQKYNKAFGYTHRQDLSYYPVWYTSENHVLKAIKLFEKNHIFPRRYFYPALNTIFSKQRCPKAEDSASRVLCLPLYYELTNEDIKRIIHITLKTFSL